MGLFCDTRQAHAVAFLPKPSRFTSLCVNLGSFVGQRLPELLPELGRIRMPMLFDRVAHGKGKHFVFGPRDRDTATTLAGHPAAIDHLA